MRTAFRLVAAALGALLCAAPPGPRTLAAPVTFESLLAQYRSGDRNVVSRTLATADGFAAFQPSLRAALAAGPGAWDDVGALFVLEVLVASAAHLRPVEAAALVQSARKALAVRSAHPRGAAFDRQWHETALAELQHLTLPNEEDAYLDALEHEAPDAAARTRDWPRFALDRAIAREQACWHAEQLDQPTTSLTNTVETPTGPAAVKVCRAAMALFDRAAAFPATAIEAGLRGAVTRFRLGEYDSALETASAALVPGADTVQRYWTLLVKARSLQSLSRFDETQAAYREASSLYPDAETPMIGLALSLFAMHDGDEAVAVAAKVRSMRVTGGDPWWSYYGADARFVDPWIHDLRGRLK